MLASVVGCLHGSSEAKLNSQGWIHEDLEGLIGRESLKAVKS